MQLNIPHLVSCEDREKQLRAELQNLLHMLEDLDLNAAQMVKVAAKIRDTRRERRYWRELVILKQKMGEKGWKGLLSWTDCKRNRAEKYKAEATESKARMGL